MKWQMLLIRITYWLGIVIDAAAAVLLMVPSLNAAYSGWPVPEMSRPLFSALGTASALMWGWTGLLWWANRKPVERRGVLLLTLAPVLIGIQGTQLIGIFQYGGSYSPLGPFLVIMFTASYYFASQIAAGKPVIGTRLTT
jgi:hypothetical protein